MNTHPEPNTKEIDITIVGAGPVGLMCAYLAHLSGLRAVVLDRSAGPLEVGRADALNARTLQLLEVADLFDDLYPLGKKCDTSSVWANGAFVSRQFAWWKELEGCLHKHFLMLGQSHVEKLLDRKLRGVGHAVRRKAAVAEREGARHVIFLGDFVHSAFALSEETVTSFAKWREAFACEVTVLLGNHDRGLDRRWPSSWRNVRRAHELRLDPFLFRHEPPEKAAEPDQAFTWAGHLHPVVRLSDGADHLRLPCFFVGPRFALLPAFTELAGGYELRPTVGDRAFVVAENSVIEVGPRLGRRPPRSPKTSPVERNSSRHE